MDFKLEFNTSESQPNILHEYSNIRRSEKPMNLWRKIQKFGIGKETFTRRRNNSYSMAYG